MSLKAVFFDFNGVIINDEAIHEQLIAQVLISENLLAKPGDYQQVCLGRSDRICLHNLLSRQGRVVSETYLTQLIKRKAQAYQQELAKLEKLPLFPGLEELLIQMRDRQLKLAIVSGAIRSEIELVLNSANLAQYFSLIVAGDDITTSKPEPDGYLLAIKRLNEQDIYLNLKSEECLVIEDTPAGIAAAKQAGMGVVGIANTYPFHMLQRQANWTIDYLGDLEIDRVQQVYTQKQTFKQQTAA